MNVPPFAAGGSAPKAWFNGLPPLMENLPYRELAALNQKLQAGDASVWICPEAERIEQSTFFPYGMNMALSTPFMGRPDHIERVGPTQTIVFMADGRGPYCSVIPHPQPYSPVARHVGGSVNLAFLDGRVESYLGDDVGCDIDDPKRPDIRWFPPNSKWPGPP